MRRLFFFKCIIYWTCSIYAQENINSIYFDYPESNDFRPQKMLPVKFKGSFLKQDDSLIELKLDSNGISIFHNVVFQIPKEKMKEFQTSILNDSIFGIKKNIGLPFKSINDTIYAYLKQEYPIYVNDSSSSCFLFDNQLFLFSKAKDSLYSVIKLSFQKDTLFLVESDPSIFNESLISDIKIINKNKSFFLLEKNENNWKRFIKNGGFNDTTLYYKK